VSDARDPILDGIRNVHGLLVEAGRAYVAGDLRLALELLEDARVGLRDSVADVRDALDPEPKRT
jgi:hypothetical protein